MLRLGTSRLIGSLAPYVFPICGGRKVSHLQSNIEALSLRLSPAEIDEIDSAYDFQLGFPHNFITGSNRAAHGPEDVLITKRLGHFDYVQGPRPITPYQEPQQEERKPSSESNLSN